MKRKYVKPMLSKESFALTETVATGCGGLEVETNFNTPEQCYMDIGDGDRVFYNPSACENTDVEEEWYCYNSMTGGMPIFRS